MASRQSQTSRNTSTQSDVPVDEDLRDQLHDEIERRARPCANSHFECTLPCLADYKFCLKHILQDSQSPYRQCAYVFPRTSRKCPQPAPILANNKRDPSLTTYCFEHTSLVRLEKTRRVVGQFKKAITNESLIADVIHHVKKDEASSSARVNSPDIDPGAEDDEIDVEGPNNDPFTEIDANKILNSGRNILDYASDTSASDREAPNIYHTWCDYDMDSSNDESLDSENEDYLKHATVYTAEEAVKVATEKLRRLQQCYIDQVYRLQHCFRERRRDYLHDLKREREEYCSIASQDKYCGPDIEYNDTFRQLNGYRRLASTRAVLRKKYLDKRMKASQFNPKPGPQLRCSFTEGGVKCSERPLPCTKFCRKHILEDKKQVLFKACGVEKVRVTCQDPIYNIFENETCVLHRKIPQQVVYMQKKNESDTEEEDNKPLVTNAASSSSTAIKMEDPQPAHADDFKMGENIFAEDGNFRLHYESDSSDYNTTMTSANATMPDILTAP